jgi:hypothetical protein
MNKIVLSALVSVIFCNASVWAMGDDPEADLPKGILFFKTDDSLVKEKESSIRIDWDNRQYFPNTHPLNKLWDKQRGECVSGRHPKKNTYIVRDKSVVNFTEPRTVAFCYETFVLLGGEAFEVKNASYAIEVNGSGEITLNETKDEEPVPAGKYRIAEVRAPENHNEKIELTFCAPLPDKGVEFYPKQVPEEESKYYTPYLFGKQNNLLLDLSTPDNTEGLMWWSGSRVTSITKEPVIGLKPHHFNIITLSSKLLPKKEDQQYQKRGLEVVSVERLYDGSRSSMLFMYMLQTFLTKIVQE